MEIVAEEWRSAVGYEGFYEVSSLGNVRSLDRLVPAKVGNGRQYWGTRLHRGKELTPTGHRKHYLKIEASIENRQHTVLVHRMVADAFLGPRPEGCEVNHIDGNKHNNAAENLEYVTKSRKHASRTGQRFSCGWRGQIEREVHNASGEVGLSARFTRACR